MWPAGAAGATFGSQRRKPSANEPGAASRASTSNVPSLALIVPVSSVVMDLVPYGVANEYEVSGHRPSPMMRMRLNSACVPAVGGVEVNVASVATRNCTEPPAARTAPLAVHRCAPNVTMSESAIV